MARTTVEFWSRYVVAPYSVQQRQLNKLSDDTYHLVVADRDTTNPSQLYKFGASEEKVGFIDEGWTNHSIWDEDEGVWLTQNRATNDDPWSNFTKLGG